MNGLIAPLDILRFILAYVLVAGIPGYAVATLARPRAQRSERLALTIPCAYSIVALDGLATALLHISFGLVSYALLAVPVTIIAVWAQWSSRTAQRVSHAIPEQTREHHGTRELWWLIPAGVALIQTLVVLVTYARYVVPVGFDTVIHVQWTAMIARTHTYPLSLISSHVGANDGAFYPAAFHALAALVLAVAPMATYRAVFLTMVVVAGLLPLSLFTCVRAATGMARLGALAALAGLAFEPLPLFALAQGLYPVTVALLFMPALAVTLRQSIAGNDRRALALVAVLGIGLLYTHPTEFVAAGLLMVAIVPSCLADRRLWMRAIGQGMFLVAIWIAAVFPARAALHSAMAYATHATFQVADGFTPPTHLQLSSIMASYVGWIYGRNMSYLLLAAVIVGIAWCLIQRRWRGFVLAQLILFALFVDANGYDFMQYVRVLSFHWTALERITPFHYWVVLPLAAVGIDAAVRGSRRLTLHARISVGRPMLMATSILLGIALPLGITVVRVAAYSAVREVVAPPDLGALDWLARHAPTQAVVLNDGDMTNPAVLDGAIDAGLWMPAISNMQPVFFRATDGVGTIADRFNILAHVADRTLPAAAKQFMQRAHIRYVYYGAHVAPGTTRHLVLAQLLAAPDLHLAFTSAPSCRETRPGREATGCPSNASYVFAVQRGT